MRERARARARGKESVRDSGTDTDRQGQGDKDRGTARARGGRRGRGAGQGGQKEGPTPLSSTGSLLLPGQKDPSIWKPLGGKRIPPFAPPGRGAGRGGARGGRGERGRWAVERRGRGAGASEPGPVVEALGGDYI